MYVAQHYTIIKKRGKSPFQQDTYAVFSEEDVSKIVDLRLRGKIMVHLGGSMIIRFSYHAQTLFSSLCLYLVLVIINKYTLKRMPQNAELSEIGERVCSTPIPLHIVLDVHSTVLTWTKTYQRRYLCHQIGWPILEKPTKIGIICFHKPMSVQIVPMCVSV